MMIHCRSCSALVATVTFDVAEEYPSECPECSRLGAAVVFAGAAPPAATCASCEHFPRCAWLIQRGGEDVSCDWEPSRYARAVVRS
jgi:hypothetical protein